jgi:hypothetical protein
VVLILETDRVSERLRVREIDDDEGRRLVRIVRRGSGSVVTWRRAQMVLLSAQGMDVAAIAGVAFASEDRVRATNSSWLNRVEAQFTALRYFALDGTDHASHKEQASMIRRYIIWRNSHAYDQRLRQVVTRANVA